MDEIVIPKRNTILVEQGVYQARIHSIERTEGKYGEQLLWRFKLSDDVELIGWTSTTYSEISKLYKWYAAALGSQFDPTADFKSSLVIGKDVQIDVSVKLGTDGNRFNKVENVLAFPKQRYQPQKADVQSPPMPEPPPTVDAIPW
jgi:hypothetical protein